MMMMTNPSGGGSEARGDHRFCPTDQLMSAHECGVPVDLCPQATASTHAYVRLHSSLGTAEHNEESVAVVLTAVLQVLSMFIPAAAAAQQQCDVPGVRKRCACP
jgi:hypothetical protein